MNNRLDFISEFQNKELAINEMTLARNHFIDIDDRLRQMVDPKLQRDAQIGRQVALARTHIEEALEHTIKALCLIHEKK